MIKIPIKQEEVEEAKKTMAKFDAQKTYNKFVCKTNYIGLLGEMVLDRYLNENNVNHEWIEFVKKGWNEPDFKINGKSIDLKTTYSDSMWYQNAICDIYIYAQMSQDNQFLLIKSWDTKENLEKSKSSGKAKAVTRGSRVDYVIPPNKMLPITWLTGVFPPLQQLYNQEVSQ